MVDGLEHRMGERLRVARVDLNEPGGASLARRYRIGAIPAFVLLDAHGAVRYRKIGGRPDTARIEAIVATP